MNVNITEYIENSFLKPLLDIEDITDISYNGLSIFYVTNSHGRKKYSETIEEKIIYDFLRQIVNLTDSQFSFSHPILDVSIGKYRINATHYSMTRKNREKALNFSIRIGFDGLRIKDDNSFILKKCLNLVDLFLKNRSSIVIGGSTGSGKTELQKFFISRLNENTRLIVIDNLNEIENDNYGDHLDVQTWQIADIHKGFTFDNFIKNALRSNPDWVILSEARGKEMLNVLNSAMSGHPTITTLHAKDSIQIYSRMTRMCLQNSENLKYSEVLEDVLEHFKLTIFIKKCKEKDSNKIVRYVDSIATNYKGNIIEIFKYPNNYKKLPKDIFLGFDMSSIEIDEFNKEWSDK